MYVFQTCLFLKQNTGYTEKNHPGKQYGHFGSKKNIYGFIFLNLKLCVSIIKIKAKKEG